MRRGESAASAHLARLAWLANDRPAWPAAMDAVERYGGQVVAGLAFDAAAWGLPTPEDRVPVARTGAGDAVGIDADGAAWIGDRRWDDVDSLIEAYRNQLR
jgi:hypothetical protein